MQKINAARNHRCAQLGQAYFLSLPSATKAADTDTKKTKKFDC